LGRTAADARQGIPIPELRFKLEVARQASSRSLCASVRAGTWADEAEQQLSRLPLLDGNYLETFAFSEYCCWRKPAGPPIPGIRLKFEVARQGSSPSLCASVRAVTWADEVEQQLSRLATSGCQLPADVCISGAGLPETPCTVRQNYISSLTWAILASSPSLCASVRAVPWADEAEQQLSRLALSGCELAADVLIVRVGPSEAPGTDKRSYL